MSDGQASRVGSMFGPYHLKRLLGRGGMGEVYEAEHTVKEWTVAVKLMSDTFSRDPVSQANNVIVDINACGYHISDQGGQITDKIVAKIDNE